MRETVPPLCTASQRKPFSFLRSRMFSCPLFGSVPSVISSGSFSSPALLHSRKPHCTETGESSFCRKKPQNNPTCLISWSLKIRFRLFYQISPGPGSGVRDDTSQSKSAASEKEELFWVTSRERSSSVSLSSAT